MTYRTAEHIKEELESLCDYMNRQPFAVAIDTCADREGKEIIRIQVVRKDGTTRRIDIPLGYYN